MKKISIAIVLLGCLILSSCGNKPATWTTSFDEGRAQAQKQNKELLLYFTGIDWDEKSAGQKANVLDTEAFLAAVGKDYVLVQIDYPMEETEENAAQLEIANNLTSQYSIQKMPTMLLLTQDGYVIEQVDIADDVTTPEAYLAYLEGFSETTAAFNQAAKAVNSSKGVKKATAIDTLFEMTNQTYRTVLNDLVKEFCELDPENETGLLGKYIFQSAYANFTSHALIGDIDGAINEFVSIADNTILSEEQRIECWYNAAYLSAMAGFPLETQLDYLKKGIAVNPDNEMATQLTSVVEGLQAQNEE